MNNHPHMMKPWHKGLMLMEVQELTKNGVEAADIAEAGGGEGEVAAANGVQGLGQGWG